MKKTVRYSMTVLLVFVLLLALLVPTFATAASAAGGAAPGKAGTPEQTLGSNDVGWLKVTYTDSKISVVIRPDTTEVKEVTLSEVKSILKTMLEAAIEVTLENVKNKFIGDEYGDDFKNITVSDAFELALDNYVADKYDGADEDEKYFNFLKAALQDAKHVSRFADYVCTLLRDVVKMGFLDEEDLISDGEVKNKLDSIFDDEFDTRVNTRVETYMQEYFDWLEGETDEPEIEASVLSHVNGLTADYVRDEAERAMGPDYDPNDKLQTIIQKYIEKNKGQEFIDENGEIRAGNELDVLFACLEEVKNDDPATYDDILEIVEDEAKREIHLGTTVDKVISEYLGVESRVALEAKKDEYVELIVNDYKDTVDEIKAEDGAEMGLLDLATYLESVTVNGYPLLINDPVNGAMVWRDGLVDFFNEAIPTLDDVAATADEDMSWTFSVLAGTTYGDCAFDLVLSVGDETDSANDRAIYCSRVRRAAAKLAEYVKYSVDKNNTIQISLTVPQLFSKAVLAGLNASTVPDHLKRQVFELFTMSLNDAADKVDEFTFEQFIDALEDIDFEDVLRREELEQFVDLSHIDNEEIVNKFRGRENAFNEAKDLLLKFLRKVPAEFRNKTILEFYRGNGTFDYNGTHEVDLEQLLTRITKKYGSTLSAFFGEDFNSVTFDLDITFRDVSKITYTSDGSSVVSEGMLPTGAAITMFAPTDLVDANGESIVVDYWVDAATGERVDKMPEYDVVLRPVAVIVVPSLSWDYTGPFTYDGLPHNVVLTEVPDGFVVEYTYKNAAGEIVSDVINAGSYTVSVRVMTDAGVEVAADIEPLTYEVLPAEIDLSGAEWTGSEFTYDGTEHSVKLNVEALLGDLPESILVYANNAATKPGTYTATVEVVLPAEYEGNYKVILPSETTHTWVIKPGVIDMSGVTVSDYTVNYNGEYYSVIVNGLPANVVAEYESYNLPGEYDVVVKFTYTGADADCYEAIPDATAKLVINEVIPTLEWDYTVPFTYDGKEHKVVVKEVPKGFNISYTYTKDGAVVTEVINAGSYTVTATVTNVGDQFVTSVELEYEILPCVIDLSGAEWTASEFFYSGAEYTVKLNVDGLLGVLPESILVYANNVATNPGTYSATVKVVLPAEYEGNYLVKLPAETTHTWVIKDETPTLEWDYTGDFTYDGKPHNVVVKEVPAGFRVEYIYTVKGGATVDNVINAGTYIAKALLVNEHTGNVVTIDLEELEYVVNVRKIDLSDATWSGTEFTYNGTEHSVKLNVEGLLDLLPESALVYTNNAFVKPGTYTATVEVVLPAELVGNCEITLPAKTSHEWKINKGVIDMSGVTVSNNTVKYDGNLHSVIISGLPANVEAKFESYREPGTYNVVVEFVYTGADADCYESLSVKSATLTITADTPEAPKLEWNYTEDFTYDGKPHNVVVKETPAGYTVEYTYTKDGAVVTEVVNAGTYTVSVVVKNAAGDVVAVDLAPLTYKVNVLKIDLSDVIWNGTEFTYDGAEHSVKLNVGDKLGIIPESVLVYANNAATVPGTYTATVEVVLPAELVGNCEITLPAKTSHEWKINKAVIDMSGVTVSDNTVKYDGKAHTVNVSGLPAGVKAEYDSYIEVGTYTVVVKFTYTGENADCYELSVTSKTATLTITAPDTPDIPKLEWNYTGDFTYNGEAHSVTVNGLPAGYTVEYTYTKDGAVVTEVVNAGTYTVSVVVKNAAGDVVAVDLAPLTFKVLPVQVDLSGATWVGSAFGYDGTEHSVKLNVEGLLGNLPESVLVYTNNAATKPGTYTATVECVLGEYAGNYEVILPENTSYEWSISFGVINMGGVTVADTTVDYDGGWHTVEVSGLPAGVEARPATYRFPGEYDVVVEFVYTGADADCYEALASMSAKLVIIPKYNNNYEYRDPETDELIISIDAENGLLVDFVLNVDDRSYAYDKVDLSETKYGKVVVAYDISFIQDGIIQSVSDTFTVTMLIPEEMRGNENLEVVYVADDGTVEVLEFVVEGNYAKFTTTHFSIYSIVESRDIEAPAEPLDLTWLWILLIVLGCLVVVGAIILIIILIKRKKDGEDPTEPTEEPAPTEPDDGDGEAVAEEASEEEAPSDEAPVAEAPAEEASLGEDAAPAEEESVPTEKKRVFFRFADEDEDVESDDDVVLVRFRTSFESRFIQSEAEIQDYYTAIKNALLSYKGVKARTSWNYESFNKARVQCAKLNIKGSALLVYLGLDPANYNANKYHFTDMSDKPKFEKVPLLMKVKSERALKYTLELIDEMMKELGIPAGDLQTIDYRLPYETTEALAARGLVKVILPAGMTFDDDMSIVKVDVGAHIANDSAKDQDEAPKETHVVVEAPEDIHVDIIAPEDVVYVDAEHADEILTNDEAVSKIEVIHTGAKNRKGKLVAINLDVICDNYESGEMVSIDTLKEKGLIPANAARVKILARGVMTKALTIVASKYSLAAVKMIYLAGGLAELED